MRRKGNWLILDNDDEDIVSIRHISSIEKYDRGRSKIITTSEVSCYCNETPEEVLKIIIRRE